MLIALLLKKSTGFPQDPKDYLAKFFRIRNYT